MAARRIAAPAISTVRRASKRRTSLAQNVTPDAAPNAVAAGTLVEVSEGCDKSFATCVARFGNGANFRGEPHLPGIDLLTRYPGA